MKASWGKFAEWDTLYYLIYFEFNLCILSFFFEEYKFILKHRLKLIEKLKN